MQVRCQGNRRTINESWQNGEIAVSSVIFVIKRSKVAQSLLKKGRKAVGVWYQVKGFTNAGLDIRHEHCGRWCHTDNKCGNLHKGGYSSGSYRTSDHMCNAVVCTAKHRSLQPHAGEVPQLQRKSYCVQ
jgi:hypothetical protein